MIFDNNYYNLKETETIKENDLSIINSIISSGKKNILNTKSLTNNSYLNNTIKKIFQSNYSFSDKTIKNESSKTNINFIEEQLFPLDKQSNKKDKKEIPVMINYSDYYYCPESKIEKNLKDQIMKYLKENNLVNNIKTINKNNSNKKCKNDKLKNNKLDINNDKDKSLENKLIQVEIENSNENKKHNEELKISNKKQNSNNSLKKYLEQMESKKNLNTEINQINNIKIENLYLIKDNNNINNIITSTNAQEVIKNTETTNDDSKIVPKEKLNNYKEIFNKKKFDFNNGMFSYNKINKKDKNKKFKSSHKNKINIIKKINNPYSDSNNILNQLSKINNRKNEKNKKPESDKNFINENSLIKNKINNSKNKINFSTISLQSINDSKLLILADDLIPKDDEFDKFKANNIIHKQKNKQNFLKNL